MPVGMRFEVVLYSEQLEVAKALSSVQTIMPPSVSRTLECRLIIDPFQAKSIAQWLTAQVNAFEKQFGHIPSTEELQEKLVLKQTTKRKTKGSTNNPFNH